MCEDKLKKLDSMLGIAINSMPLGLIFFNEEDGAILKYNKRGEDIVLQCAELEQMPKTVFIRNEMLSEVADKMRNGEEFEFYVTYDSEQERFVPLSHIASADIERVIVATNFPAVDPNGEKICGGLIVRPLSQSRAEYLFSDVENAKNSLLTSMFGMTQLRFMPKTMTMDATGGRDNYNLVNVPVEEVSKVMHVDYRERFINEFKKIARDMPDSAKFLTKLYSISLQSYRYFKIVLFAQIDSLGNKLSYGGFCIDVSEEELAIQKKNEEMHKLEKAKEAAQTGEHNIIKELANISHDLRNPISIIMGYSDMMADTDARENRAKQNKVIQDTSQRLLSMVNEILTLNKHEYGKMNCVLEEFDLEQLLISITEMHKLQFGSNGLSLKFESHGAPFKIICDPSRLSEILENYLSNALKYTKQGGAEISYEIIGNDVRIHVKDTGPGISEEDCKRVFNRFEQLASKIKGNGLGLNICSAIANALCGQVGVESEEGVGSDFWVQIPR